MEEREIAFWKFLKLFNIASWEHIYDVVQAAGADGREERVAVPEQVKVAHPGVVRAPAFWSRANLHLPDDTIREMCR